MSEIKNGVPAFPSHGTMGEVTHEGMTMRDYFAAKAMQGICANPDIPGWDFDAVVFRAYGIADAMIRVRGAS